MTTIEDLPREIVSLICSLLKQPEKYNCVFVNKEFHSASIPELWREPTLPTTYSLHQLIKCLNHSKHQRGDYIRMLKLDYTISIHDEELLSLLQLIPNLEVLEIRQAEQLTDKSIIPISKYCKQLRTLLIVGSPMSYRSAHYLGKCQQLQRLTLAACPNLTPMTLLPFAECAIEYLDLSGCKWLTASDTAIDLCSFTHLTHLTLICCDAISSDFLHRLTGALPQLQDFSITGNAVIDDDAIIPFLKTHTRIRGLFLLECAITDSTLEVIANYLPDLHNLDISFCTSLTPNGIRILVDRCQNLRLLGLKECSIARGDLPEIPYDENEPFFNTLTFIELDYMRNNLHEGRTSQDRRPQDDEQEQDESVRESYAYIQRYLNTEQVH